MRLYLFVNQLPYVRPRETSRNRLAYFQEMQCFDDSAGFALLGGRTDINKTS